jgi:hypothetical protein
MKSVLLMLLVLLFASPCFAQDRYQLDTRPGGYVRYGERYASPYANPPRLYSGSKYLGELSQNRYAPDSVSNPYSRYGSRYSPESINNPYSPYGVYRTQPIYVYPRR